MILLTKEWYKNSTVKDKSNSHENSKLGELNLCLDKLFSARVRGKKMSGIEELIINRELNPKRQDGEEKVASLRKTAGEKKSWHAGSPRQKALSMLPWLLEIRSIPVTKAQLLVTLQLSVCNQTALKTGKTYSAFKYHFVPPSHNNEWPTCKSLYLAYVQSLAKKKKITASDSQQ